MIKSGYSLVEFPDSAERGVALYQVTFPCRRGEGVSREGEEGVVSIQNLMSSGFWVGIKNPSGTQRITVGSDDSGGSLKFSEKICSHTRYVVARVFLEMSGRSLVIMVSIYDQKKDAEIVSTIRKFAGRCSVREIDVNVCYYRLLGLSESSHERSRPLPAGHRSGRGRASRLQEAAEA